METNRIAIIEITFFISLSQYPMVIFKLTIAEMLLSAFGRKASSDAPEKDFTHPSYSICLGVLARRMLEKQNARHAR